MTDNSFDKFIRDKLGNHTSPVPEGLWEKIAQEKEKKPAGIFWWRHYGYLTLIGLVAVFLGTTVFLSSNDLTQTAELKKISRPVSDDEKPLLNLSKSKATHAPIAATSTFSSHTSSKHGKSFTHAKVDVTQTSIVDKKPVVQPSKVAAKRVEKDSHLPSLSQRKKTLVHNPYKGGMNSMGRMERTLNTNNYNTYLSKPVYLATAQTDKSLTENSGSDLIDRLKKFKLFSMDCPPAREPIRNDIYIEVYGSPDYARKTINSAGAANAAFLQRKDSTETMRLSYTIGFRLSKTLGENLLLKAGIQYSQINEKFSYRNENERRLTTVVTIRTIVRPAGDTVTVRDTSMVEQIGYRVKTTYNRYRSIDLPLLIGFEWGNASFKAAVSAGAILNLYSWQQGESLDTTYMPVAFNKSSGQTFKQNIGVGLFAGFSLLKRTSEKTELFMEPYFRYNISNMTNNQSLFNQKFRVAGVNMGIRYKLNGNRQR